MNKKDFVEQQIKKYQVEGVHINSENPISNDQMIDVLAIVLSEESMEATENAVVIE